MFRNIRLSGPLLESIELRDLSRINVLCGPNNSGKTTVLKGLADSSARSHGIAITDSVAERLCEATNEHLGQGDRSAASGSRPAIYGGLWFENDRDSFVAAVVRHSVD